MDFEHVLLLVSGVAWLAVGLRLTLWSVARRRWRGYAHQRTFDRARRTSFADLNKIVREADTAQFKNTLTVGDAMRQLRKTKRHQVVDDIDVQDLSDAQFKAIKEAVQAENQRAFEEEHDGTRT